MMQLTPFCLMLSCLQLSPDRSQFFRYESFSLSCSSSSWRVQKRRSDGSVRTCAASNSSCVIRKAYPMDSGTYWCQSAGGRSNAVNITVSEGPLLLESPALAVREGAPVSLRCRDSRGRSNGSTFHFYRDGTRVHSSNRSAEMTLLHASKSHQGLYKCSVEEGGEESESSWLAVQEASTQQNFPAAPSSSPSAPPPSAALAVSGLWRHLVVAAPYLLSTILLGFIHRGAKTGEKKRRRRRADSQPDLRVCD